MKNEEGNYWLGFSVFSGVGPIKFKKLLDRFGSARDAWRAPVLDLKEALGETLAERFDEFRNKFSISDYTRILLAQGVSLLTLEDEGYPRLLKKIKNPPFLLYVKGDVEILKQVQHDPSTSSGQAKYIAVVGTRKATQYGREVTKILTEELVVNDFTIVSGLAIGIDAVSHKTALQSRGKTIAVLGCGVDCCYPLANQAIYNSIVNGSGCVVSEYPLGQRPTKGSFPARNRIIAGLSLGVLVTEGAEDSGALITANYALKFGRPVFAVPGPITSSLSRGPYKLISHGAKLVTTANDILKELKIQKSKVKTATQNSKVDNATEEERMIIEILQNEPLHFDELVRRTGFDSSTTGSLLSLMEIKGMIKNVDSGQFSIAS